MEYPISMLNTLHVIFGGSLVIRENLEQPYSGMEPVEEERIRKTNDEIHRLAKMNHARFKAMFPMNIFINEWAILYEILANFNVNSTSEEQIRAMIDYNRDLVLDSPYIDLTPYTKLSNGNIATADEQLLFFKESVVGLVKNFKGAFVSEASFQSSCSIFLNWYKQEFMTETINQMALINSANGADIRLPGKRRVTYKGYIDAQRYYNERMNILASVEEENRVRHIVYDVAYIENQMDANIHGDKGDKFILDTGISEIDSVMGKLRRTEVLGILGPPKGGKTRFSAYLASRALLNGKNVAIWPLEGTIEEWEAYVIVSIIRQRYGISIQTSDIIQKKYMAVPKTATKEEKERASKISNCINTTKIELASGNKYGKLSFIDGPAYLEDFLDTLESHYTTNNPYDVVVIDSLVNIMSKNSRGVKTEVISKAYQNFKQFIAKRLKVPPMAIVPAQLKQSTVDFLRKNPDETIDVTAGGESAETIRTPDEVIGIFSSKEERAADTTNFYHVASRHGSSFDDFTARAEYGCCYFTSMEN